MKIELEPTEEVFELLVDGVRTGGRVWTGKTSGGVAIWTLILAVVPTDQADAARLRGEFPKFMRAGGSSGAAEFVVMR